MSDPMREAKYKPGSKPSSAAEKYRKLQEQSTRDRGSLKWSDCPSEELVDMVAAVTEDGAAILLAKTSDGGALVVRVIADKESVPFYAPDMAALNHLLMEIRSSAA